MNVDEKPPGSPLVGARVMAWVRPRSPAGVRFGLAVLALLLVSLGFRFQRPGASGLLVEREFRTAILARSLALTLDSDVPQWRLDAAKASRTREGLLEPPLTETLMGIAVAVTDAEPWGIGRLITSCFWLIGALFLFRIARAVASPEAALLPVAYYLLNPLAVGLSRSLQPDALMMLAFLIALGAIWRAAAEPTRGRWVVASVLSGLAVLVKPHAVFFLLGAGLGVLAFQGRLRRARDILTFAALTILPSAAYYVVVAIATSGWDAGMVLNAPDDGRVSMAENALRMINLEWLRRFAFWRDWFVLGVDAVGYAALCAALVGLACLQRSAFRAMLMGMWLAYPVFGIAFSNRIADHGYYHAVMIPIVALSMASAAELLWTRIRSASLATSVPIAGLLAAGLALAFLDTRHGLRTADVEPRQVLEDIGAEVRHSTRTVYVAHHYGRAMEYWGELSGIPWPKAGEPYGVPPRYRGERSLEERLSALSTPPEYFIITDFVRFERDHTDLKNYLATQCRELAHTDAYWIYTSCRPLAREATAGS